MSIKLFSEVVQRGHEQLTVFNDPKSGLRAIVSIHSSVLGPALGGVRVHPYQDESSAFNDVLRLSEAMSYKSAIAGMSLGGGKACIIADPKISVGRKELFESFGNSLNILGGRYITAEDMGTSAEDMQTIRNISKHVVGFSKEHGGSGDPSPWTAKGVLQGIIAACENRYGTSDLNGKTVSIQGVGNVGFHLAKLLDQIGCKLIISDTSADRINNALSILKNAKAVKAEAIYDCSCNIFAACAIGQTINSRTIPLLKTDIICGAANNQLSGPDVYEIISERGILYCPDFVVNAGGVISVGAELNQGGWDHDWVSQKVDQIKATTTEILERSASKGMFPEVVALEWAKEIIQSKELSR
jgi:leucine dehydrogenase